MSEEKKAQEIIKNLIRGNIKYASRYHHDYDDLKSKQTPKVTLVTCSDSRIPQNLFSVDAPNEIFMIRNIGNQFRNSEGSIKYSLLHLNTPIMIVMGHTGCGAITAATGDYREEDDTIQREVVGLVNSVRLANQKIDAHNTEDKELRLALYAQVNVDHQVNKIISEYTLKSKIEQGKLYVFGMMFDIHGIYSDKSAHVYITNINGITDIEKLKEHPLIEELEKEIKELKIKRL